MIRVTDIRTNIFPTQTTQTVARDMKQLPTQHFSVLHNEAGTKQFDNIFLKPEQP
jgi:hypothetical protein